MGVRNVFLDQRLRDIEYFDFGNGGPLGCRDATLRQNQRVTKLTMLGRNLPIPYIAEFGSS